MDQLSFAENRRLGTINSDVVLFFLHLFKLWHLNQDLMDLLLCETFEDIGTLSLVHFLLLNTLLLEVLKVANSLALIADVILQSIVKLFSSLFLSLHKESLGVDVYS